MEKFKTSFTSIMLTAALLSVTSISNVVAKESTSKLLTANFDARKVVKVEAGDFHFIPGQPAPIHTHEAPAVGYVAKGDIIYQVEGEKPQLLHEGDAFYEPAGPRILRFDNASATEEAIFVDFNLQQEGEPFIVFEKELTAAIDRRTLPTVKLDGKDIKQVDIFVSELDPNGSKALGGNDVIVSYVAEGIVELQAKGKKNQRVVAGQSFSIQANKSNMTIVNTSSDVPAKVVAFHLH